VKTKEVFFLTMLFVFGFFMAEFLVNHLLLFNPLQRFIARVGIQFMFYGLIYLLFDSRDISRRLNRIEHHIPETNSDKEEILQKIEKEGE